MAEAFVRVAPDSTGARIRNIQLDVPQSDGSIATVMMQVINIRDADGTPIITSDSDVLRAMYRELAALREMYGIATGTAAIGLMAQVDDVADIGR